MYMYVKCRLNEKPFHYKLFNCIFMQKKKLKFCLQLISRQNSNIHVLLCCFGSPCIYMYMYFTNMSCHSSFRSSGSRSFASFSLHFFIFFILCSSFTCLFLYSILTPFFLFCPFCPLFLFSFSVLLAPLAILFPINFLPPSYSSSNSFFFLPLLTPLLFCFPFSFLLRREAGGKKKHFKFLAILSRSFVIPAGNCCYLRTGNPNIKMDSSFGRDLLSLSLFSRYRQIQL